MICWKGTVLLLVFLCFFVSCWVTQKGVLCTAKWVFFFHFFFEAWVVVCGCFVPSRGVVLPFFWGGGGGWGEVGAQIHNAPLVTLWFRCSLSASRRLWRCFHDHRFLAFCQCQGLEQPPSSTHVRVEKPVGTPLPKLKPGAPNLDLSAPPGPGVRMRRNAHDTFRPPHGPPDHVPGKIWDEFKEAIKPELLTRVLDCGAREITEQEVC